MKKVLQFILVLALIAGTLGIGNRIFDYYDSKITFRLLDHDCQPLANTPLTIVEDKRYVPLPYMWAIFFGVPAVVNEQFHHEITTDDDGYFSIRQKGNVGLRIYNHQDPISPDDRGSVLRDFNYHDNADEMYLLRASTDENPIVIYPVVHQPSVAIRYQSKEQTVSPYRYTDSETQEWTIYIGGNSRDIIAKLYMTQKENEVVVQLYSDSGGGLIQVSKEQLPYMPDIPRNGWKTRLEFSIRTPLPYPDSEQVYFYFRSHKGKGYGTLTLEFSFPERQMVSNVFIDGLLPAYDGPAIEQAYLPQESCTSHLARHYDGYYGRIQLSRYKKEQLKNPAPGSPREETVKIVADREALANIARAVETPLQWYARHAVYEPDASTTYKGISQASVVSRETLAIESMNNNADIVDRIELIFDSYKQAAIGWRQKPPTARAQGAIKVLARIAEDPRTPPAILQEIFAYADTDKHALKRALMANMNLPVGVADKLTTYYMQLSDISRGANDVDRKYDERVLRRFLLDNPGISPETFNRVIRESPQMHWFFRTLLRDPRVSYSTLQQLAATHEQFIGREDEEGWRKIQQSPDLRPYSRHFPLAPEENPFTAPEQLRQLANDDVASHYDLAKNPSTPSDILTSLYQMKSSHLNHALVKNLKAPANVLAGIYYNNTLRSGATENLAKNPSTPADVLLHMVDTVQHRQVTLAVAGNPSASIALIKRIYQEDYIITDGYLDRSLVERSLFCNPSTPAAIRIRLPFLLNTRCAANPTILPGIRADSPRE